MCVFFNNYNEILGLFFEFKVNCILIMFVKWVVVFFFLLLIIVYWYCIDKVFIDFLSVNMIKMRKENEVVF